MIKVRFAPSPTGFLHIGGARTALFNYLYARAQGGAFVLRVEDTDQERSRPEYLEEILQSMVWLGMDWDELYKQSERFEIYRDQARRLVADGAAYEENGAILLKTEPREIKFFDIIRGEVVFDTSNFVRRDDAGQIMCESDGQPKLKDEVLIKADGSPAYNFCCVVDDALMEISHVIRGEDHIPNTPKQLMMYEALGYKPPKFAHLPMILDEQGGKMSKRTGAVAVTAYREMGFLPEALVNYLMLLGWSPGGDLELMPLSAAVKKFSIKKVNKSAAAFSMDKLRWVNAQYLKQKEDAQVAEFVAPFLTVRKLIPEDYDHQWLTDVCALYKSRMADIQEFLDRTRYLFEEDHVFEKQVPEGLDEEIRKAFAELAGRLEALDDFKTAEVETVFRGFAEEHRFKMSQLVHPVRVALTASDVGPGLFETMAVLGKDKTVHRLKAAAAS